MKKLLFIPGSGIREMVQVMALLSMAKERIGNRREIHIAYYNDGQKELLDQSDCYDGAVRLISAFEKIDGAVAKKIAAYANLKALRKYDEIYLATTNDGCYGFDSIRKFLWPRHITEMDSNVNYDKYGKVNGVPAIFLRYQLEFAKYLNINELRDLCSPAINMDPYELEKAKFILRDIDVDDKNFAFIIVDADSPSKELPFNVFKNMVDIYLEKGFDVVVLETKRQSKSGPYFEKLTGDERERIRVLYVSSLKRKLHLLKLAKVVTGADNDLLHLSAALDQPTVAIYGPTALYNSPYGAKVKLISKIYGCKDGVGECVICEKTGEKLAKDPAPCMAEPTRKEFADSISLVTS